MDEKAPISWLISKINAIVSSGAADAARALSDAIFPIVSICFGIYMILICINYMRGAESEPVIDLGVRFAGFAVIIGLGLNASNHVDTIIPIVTDIGQDLALKMSVGNKNENSLDKLAVFYLQMLDEGYTKAESGGFPWNAGSLFLYLVKWFLVVFGLIPFLVAATTSIIVAQVGLVMVAMVGPLFFAFLIFPATRQYFSAWVNTAISYSLIPIFVAVIAKISIGISTEMMGKDLDKASLSMVFFASIGNLVLLFLLKNVSALASSLSAGGINAAMPGSIGTLASAIKDGGKAAGGVAKGGFKGAVATYRGTKAAAQYVKNKTNSIRKAY